MINACFPSSAFKSLKKCADSRKFSAGMRLCFHTFQKLYGYLSRGAGGGGYDLCSRKIMNPFFVLNFSTQAHIRDMFVDQKSPQQPEVGILGLRAQGGVSPIYWENVHEVSTTPGSGCFATSQIYRRTSQLLNKHRLWADSVKIPHPPKSFFKICFHQLYRKHSCKVRKEHIEAS